MAAVPRTGTGCGTVRRGSAFGAGRGLAKSGDSRRCSVTRAVFHLLNRSWDVRRCGRCDVGRARARRPDPTGALTVRIRRRRPAAAGAAAGGGQTGAQRFLVAAPRDGERLSAQALAGRGCHDGPGALPRLPDTAAGDEDGRGDQHLHLGQGVPPDADRARNPRVRRAAG